MIKLKVYRVTIGDFDELIEAYSKEEALEISQGLSSNNNKDSQLEASIVEMTKGA